MQRAYRRPVEDAEVGRFMSVISYALKSGEPFADAMIAGYTRGPLLAGLHLPR